MSTWCSELRAYHGLMLQGVNVTALREIKLLKELTCPQCCAAGGRVPAQAEPQPGECWTRASLPAAVDGAHEGCQTICRFDA